MGETELHVLYAMTYVGSVLAATPPPVWLGAERRNVSPRTTIVTLGSDRPPVRPGDQGHSLGYLCKLVVGRDRSSGGRRIFPVVEKVVCRGDGGWIVVVPREDVILKLKLKRMIFPVVCIFQEDLSKEFLSHYAAGVDGPFASFVGGEVRMLCHVPFRKVDLRDGRLKAVEV